MSGSPAAPPTVPEVREALWNVQDPELAMSILELGLIYDVEISEAGEVAVTMTLTSPACPAGPIIEAQVRHALGGMPGVEAVDVRIVWDPPWDPRTMASEDVRLALGIW